jgi:hypothetical protein
MRSIVITLLFFATSALVNAQSISFSKMDKSPLDVVLHRNDQNEAVARVIYSRPSKRNRKIFGDLVPYDQVWRTGANEATEIDFFKPVQINNQLVPAGSYSIYTIPGKDKWTFILNSKTLQWGNEYDEKFNILEVQTETVSAPQTIEEFSISFIEMEDRILLFMGWEDTMTYLPFSESF